MLDFKTYQQQAYSTAIYPSIGKKFVYPLLGLNGEVGELTEKLKKILRDKNGCICLEDEDDLEKELGDVLWYLAVLCEELNLDLEVVAVKNITKLMDRKARGVLQGSGDNR